MNREEIIRMAREAGEAEGMELVFHPVIERLANAAYAAGAAAEREACINECTFDRTSADIEIALRARGDK